MSKNERLFRTIVAGIVFAAIGVTAVEYDETVVQAAKRARGLASANCGTEGCAKLATAKDGVLGARASVLASHGLDPKEKTTVTIEKEIHAAEDAKLNDAGAALVLMLHAHANSELSADEISDVAIFLFDTIDYDASGIALDVLETGTDQDRASAVVRSAIEYIKKQDGTGRFNATPADESRLKTLLASLRRYLEEGKKELIARNPCAE